MAAGKRRKARFEPSDTEKEPESQKRVFGGPAEPEKNAPQESKQPFGACREPKFESASKLLNLCCISVRRIRHVRARGPASRAGVRFSDCMQIVVAFLRVCIFVLATRDLLVTRCVDRRCAWDRVGPTVCLHAYLARIHCIYCHRLAATRSRPSMPKQSSR